MTRQITLLLSCIILLLSCRKEEEIVHSTDTNVTEGEQSESIKGFFPSQRRQYGKQQGNHRLL